MALPEPNAAATGADPQGATNPQLRRDFCGELPNAPATAIHLQDPLTGMANRQAAIAWLSQHLGRCERQPLLLLAIDLDRFQWINLTYGAAQADRLLQIFARLLRTLGPQVDQPLIARLQSDEFLVAIPLNSGASEVPLQQQRNGWVETLRCQLAEGLAQCEGLPILPSFAIGSTLFTPSAAPGGTAAEVLATELLQEVNVALATARRSGFNRSVSFTARLTSDVHEEVELERRIMGALEKEEFVLYYQPVVRRDGTIVAAESLLRWPQPDGSFIPPARFIPIAEKNGHIHQIGAWIFDTAMAQVAAWRTDALPLEYISLNISAVQLCRTDNSLQLQLQRALQRHHLPAAAIQLELTETAVLDNMEQASQELEQLAAAGFRLALDDFGTGYSSLLTLQRLPFEALKIDKSFVQAIEVSPKSLALVEVSIAISQRLGLRCLAEGVETERQCQTLMKMQCDYYQGYLFDRALPSHLFEQRLRRQARRASLSA